MSERVCVESSGACRRPMSMSHCEPHLCLGNLQVGLLASSPFFAEMSKHCNPFRLIAIGLGVWTLSTAGCGIATGEPWLLEHTHNIQSYSSLHQRQIFAGLPMVTGRHTSQLKQGNAKASRGLHGPAASARTSQELTGPCVATLPRILCLCSKAYCTIRFGNTAEVLAEFEYYRISECIGGFQQPRLFFIV